MKVRIGFVSNSSSSSFILPFDKGEEFTIKLTIDDLKEVINQSEDSKVYATITTESELKERIMEQYGGRDQSFEDLIKEEGWVLDKYQEVMELLDKGKCVMFGSLDQNDQSIQSLIERVGGKVEY
jgi:hypothetical protein